MEDAPLVAEEEEVSAGVELEEVDLGVVVDSRARLRVHILDADSLSVEEVRDLLVRAGLFVNSRSVRVVLALARGALVDANGQEMRDGVLSANRRDDLVLAVLDDRKLSY